MGTPLKVVTDRQSGGDRRYRAGETAGPTSLPGLPANSALRETERVPDQCTCGAHPPPDARFCHKCGRPLYDLPPVVEEEAPPPPEPEPEPPPTKPQPPEINFHNRAAVRTGLLAAIASSLLTQLPLPMFLNLIWILVCLTAAGFFAVYLYQRRTGTVLNWSMGARMGWITGIFCFSIAAVLFTIAMAVVSFQGGLAAFYREQLNSQGAPGVDSEEFFHLLESPVGMAMMMLFSLFMLFCFFTLLPTLGGAMGAKVLEKE